MTHPEEVAKMLLNDQPTNITSQGETPMTTGTLQPQPEDRKFILVEKFREAINQLGRENESYTPDFILAQYLGNCLDALEIAINNRKAFSLPAPLQNKQIVIVGYARYSAELGTIGQIYFTKEEVPRGEGFAPIVEIRKIEEFEEGE